MSKIQGLKIIHPECTRRLNYGLPPETVFSTKCWQEHVITKAGTTPDEDIIMIRQARVSKRLDEKNHDEYYLEMMNIRWFKRGQGSVSYGVPYPLKWEPYVDLPVAYE